MNKIKDLIKKTVTNLRFWIVTVSLFTLIVTINKCYQYKVESENKTNVINSITSKFEQKDNGGKVSVIESSAKDFKNIESDDEKIIKLQEIIKKYEKQLKNKGSVTLTDNTIKHDTVYVNPLNDGIAYNHLDTINNKHINTVFGRKGDTVVYQLELQNEQTLIVKEEGSLFKKKKLVLTIENSNKYFKTTDAKTVSTYDLKQSRWGIGMNAGVQVNSKLEVKPSISFGINYNFVNF